MRKEVVLQQEYPCICSVCQTEIKIIPSELMRMGYNAANGNCPNCKSPLHYEIVPDITGSEMKSEQWPALFERLQKEFYPEEVLS
jgi:hypothetical protein